MMKWKLTIATKRHGKGPLETLLQTRGDWLEASEKTHRKPGEGDFEYRKRVWSNYTGKNVVDWESID